VRESGDLLNSRNQHGRGGLRHQRKEAKAVETLELGRCGSEQRSCRAVLLEVLVQLLGKRLRGVCREEVEPWVRRAAGVQTRSMGRCIDGTLYLSPNHGDIYRMSGVRLILTRFEKGRVAHLSMNLIFFSRSQY
jgi:hypothetical protein